jgi:CheY-like chemotaxis protein
MDFNFIDRAPQDRPVLCDVLVVDDDPCIAESLAMLLEQRGQRVRIAHNGAHALRLMTELRPQLVITDFMMPVMDGAALTIAMKGSPWLCSVPVVMSSGQEESDVQGSGAVYQAYLKKPMSIEALDAILSTLRDTVEAL